MQSVLAWWFSLSAEVQAALIGAGATAGAAVFGVLAVVAQIRSQGRQSRTAMSEGERRKVKAALYEDAVLVCRTVADASIELSTKLRIMNMEVEVAATANAVNLAYHSPTIRFPQLTTLYEAFVDSALRFIFLVENRRIVDPRILIFRTAMSVVLHDSRQLMFSDFVLHVLPTVPFENPDGGTFPYTPPSIDGAHAAGRFSSQLIETLADALAYTDDFLTEMQNLLLGDLFDSALPAREPIDPNRRAVTLERAAELEKWFNDNTAWGLKIIKAEAKARAHFAAA